MKGNDILKNQKEIKINNFIQNHSQYSSLQGFKDYISDLSLKTVLDYLFYVVAFFDYCKKESSKIQLDDYENYLSSLQAKTPSYQTSAYAALKKYSNYLFISKISTNNPMQYIKRPDCKERQETIIKRECRCLTESDIQIILLAIKNGIGNHRSIKRQKQWKDRDYLIFLIFLSTGIKLSELIQLDIDDIDFNNKQLIITNNNKINTYLLTDEVVAYAKSWLIKRNQLLNGKDEQALFISINRERISTTAVFSIIEKYSSVIPNKHITPDKLRMFYKTNKNNIN